MEVKAKAKMGMRAQKAAIIKITVLLFSMKALEKKFLSLSLLIEKRL